MTGICASLAAAGALLLASSAVAQVGPPIRLGPPGSETQPPVSPAIQLPSPALPAPAPAAAPRPAAPPPAERAAAEPGESVFGPQQWEGTAPSVSMALLQRLPSAIASPTLHDLARRLLAAPAPAASGDGARFLALRLEKLTQLGDSAAIASLVGGLPPEDPAAVQARLATLWLDGKSKEACALTDRQISRTPTVAWQQSQVACAALAGDADAVDFGMQVLAEQQFDDPTFTALVEMAGGAKTGLPKQPSFNAVSLGLARAMKGGLPPDALRSTDGSVLRAIAESRDTQPILRVSAAERAANMGALSPADLVRLYRELETSPAERADLAAAARADDGPRGRALLYLAIQAESSPGQRADLLRTALDAAVKSGTFPLAARLYQAQLTKLVPAPELARMALPVGQALYLTGEDEAAKQWYRRAQDSAGPDGGAAAARLWVLGRLADGDAFAPLETGTLMGWYELQQRREPGAAAGRLALLYALIEGLGDAVPGPAWEPLVTGKAKLPAGGVDPLLAAELRSAAESGRVGETVLLILDSIGNRLPGPDATLAAYDSLVGLRFAGLDREARDLALEIAIAAGL